MTDHPTDLLARPAAQSVRLIALGFLDDAGRALERLDDPADHNALHDFRVAVRRLRTTLRAYRPLLEEGIGKKPRKLLGEIADATNRVREAEVALAWLEPLTTGMTVGERVGLRWLIARVEQRRVEEQAECLKQIRSTFTTATRRLRKGLTEYRQTVGPEPTITDVSFRGALQAAALDAARELEALLAVVQHPDDAEAHRARIAAKRLRYLFEPVKTALPEARTLIDPIKRLQDLLGELHDLQELAVEARAAIGIAAAERAQQQLETALTEPAGGKPVRRRGRHAGLVAIAKRIQLQQTERFSDVRREFLGHPERWVRLVGALFPAPGVPIPVPTMAQRGPALIRRQGHV